MNRRQALKYIGAGALVGSMGGCNLLQPLFSRRRPNIFLLIVDTLRQDFFNSTYMPNLVAMSREGVVFTKAYSTSSLTVPSHASLFTGYIENNEPNIALREDIFFRPELEDKRTLPERLTENGYQCCGVSANKLLMDGFERGFAQYELSQGDVEQWLDAQQVAGRLAQFIESAKGKRPLFCFANFMDVHDPYGVTRQDHARYYELMPKKFDQEKMNEFVKLYIKGVSYVDRALGEFVGRLKQYNLYDDTLIVVSSDHGEAFGEDGKTNHGSGLHDPQTRIPLVIKPAGPARPATVDRLVQLSDLVPFLLHSARIDNVDKLDAKNIMTANHDAVMRLRPSQSICSKGPDNEYYCYYHERRISTDGRNVFSKVPIQEWTKKKRSTVDNEALREKMKELGYI